jgi:type II secretory pathway component PulF
VNSLTIGQSAQLERWSELRRVSRNRFVFHLTAGLLYLLLSLLAGAYLFTSLGKLEQEFLFIDTFSYFNNEQEFFSPLARLYLCVAIMIGLGSLLLILAVFNRLPAFFSPVLYRLPYIGSVWRILTMSEFCQSVYSSVIQRRTYSDALEIASRDVSDKSIRLWSLRASQQTASGKPIENVLKSMPLVDQPLPSVVFALPSIDTEIDSAGLWEQAAQESHFLLQSRVNRILRLLNVFFLVISVFVACFPILLPILGMGSVMDLANGSSSFWFSHEHLASVSSFSASALAIALILGMLRTIRLNLTARASDQIRPRLITLLSRLETLLIVLTALVLFIAVPHPETALVLFVGTLAIMFDRWLQFREDSMSLNRWIRSGARSRTPLSSIVAGFSVGCRSLVGPRAKLFASRLMKGQSVLDSAKSARLPLDADNFSSLLSNSNEKTEAGSLTLTSDRWKNDFNDLSQSEQRRSRFFAASMEQFAYSIALIFLGWLLGLISFELGKFDFYQEEFSPYKLFDKNLRYLATGSRWFFNVLVIVLLVWLMAAALIRWLPHPLVQCVPWFGARAIAQWRSTVLHWVKHQTEAERPEADAFVFSWRSTSVGWIRRRCKSAYKQLQKGMSLPAAMRYSGLISDREQIWFTSAQQNGDLSRAIRCLIDDIDRQEANRWQWRMSWFLPVAILLVGIHTLACSANLFATLANLIGWF